MGVAESVLLGSLTVENTLESLYDNQSYFKHFTAKLKDNGEQVSIFIHEISDPKKDGVNTIKVSLVDLAT